MNTITTSSIRTYSSCKRKFRLRYVDLYERVKKSTALRLGTLTHLALNAWWSGGDLCDVIDVIRSSDADPYECVMVEEMMRGYDIRWGCTRGQFEVLDVEQPFDIPIHNPSTGRAMRDTRLLGVIDVRCRGLIVEHKTTSLDISPGSSYWRRLTLDSQVSNYLLASGEPVCLYDVIRKPSKHHVATPEHKRRYTKERKLFKNQRLTDEGLDDYRERIRNEISADPQKYYQRSQVVRLGSELLEAQYDLYQQAQAIRSSKKLSIWPKNSDACMLYNTECEFFGECSGERPVETDERFRKKERAHEEVPT